MGTSPGAFSPGLETRGAPAALRAEQWLRHLLPFDLVGRRLELGLCFGFNGQAQPLPHFRLVPQTRPAPQFPGRGLHQAPRLQPPAASRTVAFQFPSGLQVSPGSVQQLWGACSGEGPGPGWTWRGSSNVGIENAFLCFSLKYTYTRAKPGTYAGFNVHARGSRGWKPTVCEPVMLGRLHPTGNTATSLPHLPGNRQRVTSGSDKGAGHPRLKQ